MKVAKIFAWNLVIILPFETDVFLDQTNKYHQFLI